MRTGEPATGDPRQRISAARYGQTLRGIDFRASDLTSVAAPDLLFFDRCVFSGADLRHATLDGCRFKLCDLTDADLRSASLRGASFSGCDLSGADLRDADLYELRLGVVGVGSGATQTRLSGAWFSRGALVLNGDRSARRSLGLTRALRGISV